MRIEAANEARLSAMLAMAQRTYDSERDRVAALTDWQPDAEAMRQALTNGLVAIENDTLQGFLLHNCQWHENGRRVVSYPVWGYGANDARTLSRLFQASAEALLTQGAARFSVNLYAHDDEAIRMFCLLQFGMECEECVRDSADKLEQGYPVRELSQTERIARWSEIWALLAQLIEHLRQSPVFYPGREFTEALYRAYLAEQGARLFVAEDGARIIGLILACDEQNAILRGKDCQSIGEAFVLPAYRGGAIARSLLAYACDTLRDEGARRFWVRHGTANPTARGFWDKYFRPYSYTMTRDVDPVA